MAAWSERSGITLGYALGLLWTIAITLPMPFYYMATDDSPSQALRLLPIAGWQATSQLGFGIAFPTLYLGTRDLVGFVRVMRVFYSK